MHHLCHNIIVAATGSEPDPSLKSDPLNDHELVADIEKEGATIKRICTTIKEEIVGQIESLSAGEIFRRLLGVLGDFLSESVENITIECFLTSWKYLWKVLCP